MSEDEKAKQIGLTVTEYHKAKVELAHLNQKLKRTAEAYSEIGRSLGESSYKEFKIDNGHFRFSYSRLADQNFSEILLNEKDLVSLIIERDAAQQKVQQLREQVRSLGLTNLE